MTEREAHRTPIKRRLRWRRFGKVLLGTFLAVWVVIPGLLFLGAAWVLRGDVTRAKSAFHTHNPVSFNAAIRQMTDASAVMDVTGHWMGHWAWLPGIGGAYRNVLLSLDAFHQMLVGAEDILPPLDRVLSALTLKGRHPNGIGNQKIQALMDTLPSWGPGLKKAYPHWQAAESQLNQIRPEAWSGILGHYASDVGVLQDAARRWVPQVPVLMRSTRVLQHLVGFPAPQRYFLVFQNSGELRATGGFMTAYGYVVFNHGKIQRLTAQNMYLLDSQVTYQPPASPVIATYLPVYYWHLRDANTSPDVPTTVGYIQRFYQSIPGAPPINGVIFIDTWFVDQLIADVNGLTVATPKGPVHLTPQNANFEMEYMAEGQGLPDAVRKKFIATMMKDLFHKVFSSRGFTLLRVLNTVNQSLNQKFILLYFNDRQAESLVARENWGGIMTRYPHADYLSVVDENLLGHKDNYVMSYHIVTRILKVGRRFQQTVTMTWTDPALDNGWLYVPYHSWVRFYLPRGAQLVSISGVDGIPYEDYVNPGLNKTVVGGHVDLPSRTSQKQPIARHTVTIRYWLPQGVPMRRLMVQMQPGINHESLTVIAGSYRVSMPLVHDVVLTLPPGY